MRNIEAPGIELNEFDRSQYNLQNSALDDAPYCFICGFSDKGENYSVNFLRTKYDLIQAYGQPQTEFEKYFYNGCLEIIQNNGICLASRLPYDNASLDKFTYCDYIIDPVPKNIGNIVDIDGYTEILSDLRIKLIELISTTIPFVDKSDYILTKYDLMSIRSIIKCLNELKDIYIAESADSTQFDDIAIVDDIRRTIINFIERTSDENLKNLCHLRILDSNLTKYISLSADESNRGSGKLTLQQYDDLKIGNAAMINGKMRIVDISKSNYDKADVSTVSSIISENCITAVVETNDCLGIVPVVVSPVNALYFQEQLKLIGDYGSFVDFGSIAPADTYSPISQLSTVNSEFIQQNLLSVDLEALQNEQNLVVPLSSSSISQQSLSKIATMQFPNIAFKNAEHLDSTYLKCIGIVVFKAYSDAANSGQVGFQLLESFVGSLDKTAKNEQTGASMYIDKIVNEQSKYINVFTNIQPQIIQQADIISSTKNLTRSLGFYKLDLTKNITITNSINNALAKVLEKIKNPNDVPLDLILDAGVSNIAQYTVSKNLSYNPDTFVYELKSFDDVKTWQSVVKKFDDFCKYTRKDCMFIADGPRPFCLINDSKLVRDSDPTSSVKNTILPKLKYISGINSSYSAGYCNWFLIHDEYSGDLFWCPPSIKVVRSYIYCDTYCHPWSVPAGMTRGRIYDTFDVAFQPNIDEAGKIYQQTWNYAISYPADGIIIEGQKTFQKSYTALDRINVRRLMLYLEKNVVRIARRFLYEGNTPYIRQQFVDSITPIFDDAVNNNGIVDYAIKCDDELNTEQVVENNEMRCKIAVKPVKALEFLILDFIVTNQTANVAEEVRR